MRSPFLALLALTLIAGCESDARKLERLRADQTTACEPVIAKDSTRLATDLATARINAHSAGSVAAAIEDKAVVARSQSILNARIERYSLHPEMLIADESTAKAQRDACTLAKRSLSLFMNGR